MTGERVLGKNHLALIDNNVVLRRIARVAFRLEAADCFVSDLWWLIAFSDVRIWCERATTIDNPAGLPYRGAPFGFFEADRYMRFSRDGERGPPHDPPPHR